MSMVGMISTMNEFEAIIGEDLSQKNDDLGLVHRWIVVLFKHIVCNSIPKNLTVGNYKKMSKLREIPFAL
ncbi:hypothetical protein JHK82_043593 [Glycine max]|nr:hypothetical protein JHK82_043593 [Glycine max]